MASKYNKKITVICSHCGEIYEILISKKKQIQLLIIDYAVCPCCHKPRNMNVWEYKDIISEKCDTCLVPFSRIKRHGSSCVMCYFRRLRDKNVAQEELFDKI